jgi:DnaJ family protein A protein 2
MDPDELFAHLFGGMAFPMSGMGPGGRRGPRKGEDSTIPYEVTLEDLYNGKTAHFNIERNVICGVCHGSGGKDKTKPQKCVKCDGRGLTTMHRPMGGGHIGVATVPCPECKGEGTKIRAKDRCKKCKGEQTVTEKKKLEIYIEKGMTEKARITLKGAGDEQPGAETGDVVFILHTKDHPTFDRSGSDLRTTVSITLSEALLGFSRVLLTHLDGRGITLNNPEHKPISSGDIIVIKGEGMPTHKFPDQKGDLYIMFEVEMPDKDWLSKVDKKALEALLPPKKPDLDPQPAIVDEVKFEGSDGAAFGGDDEDGWMDEDDDPYGDAGPECTTQ